MTDPIAELFNVCSGLFGRTISKSNVIRLQTQLSLKINIRKVKVHYKASFPILQH